MGVREPTDERVESVARRCAVEGHQGGRHPDGADQAGAPVPSSETEHVRMPGPQGAGARSGRETGFEKSLSPPKTHKRDTDPSTVFQQRRFGTTRKWVAGGVRAGLDRSKMRGARLDHAADDTPAAPQRRQGRRYGTCSAGQRPVPDVIRRAIERDGRLRPPRTAPRSGPPRPRRPPAAPRDAPLEGIDRHRDPGQPRRPSGAHRPWGLHACHPARRRFGRTPPWSSATPRASARAKEPSVGTYLRSSGR